MKPAFIFTTVLYSVIVSFISNSFVFFRHMPQSLLVIIPIFLFICIFAGVFTVKTRSTKIKICCHGTVLLCSFYVSLIVSAVCQISLAIKAIPKDFMTLVWSLFLCIGVNFIVFWIGIICVYLTSVQLGIKMRVIGLACGMIPVANLVALAFIIKITAKECLFEVEKERINVQRSGERVCAAKYPILLVHGVFFRDTKFFNYWGRIPGELQANGAQIFYGNHPSAASVSESAEYIKTRIDEILEQTGAAKVNIIAHSKGGLDCRYAISKLAIADRVASLTTVNTPHRGCLFADHLLTIISPDIKNGVAKTYNLTLKKFGEADADFLAAVNDLTDESCRRLNSELTLPEGVFCQSVGSVMVRATGGKFPLNFSYHLVKYFSGENDGLVSEDSFSWGEKYTLLRASGKRGISHGDMIDLNRENISGFDVREFYVNLVKDLKQRGL